MGSPVSSVVADISSEDLEEKAFSSYPQAPRIWHRFVDDVIMIVKRTEATRLLEHLNRQNPRIHFTVEEEKDGSLLALHSGY